MKSSAPSISRRAFLALAASAALTGGLGGAYAWRVEPNELVLEQPRVGLPRLPRALNGMTIGQLSDLHVGKWIAPETIARAADLLMTQKPHLIVLTGDLISNSSRYAASCASALAGLRAPLGVFAVLGNHDYYPGNIRETIGQFTRVGIRVLRNESVMLNANGAAFALVGVDDVSDGHADPVKAFAGVARDLFKVALVHEPDYVDQLEAYGIDLQLSGHSHGGQVRLPILGAVVLNDYSERYPIGLQRTRSATQVYTNRGIGMIGVPVRFLCPPEVTVLRLETGA